jgi:hypothetical protein
MYRRALPLIVAIAALGCGEDDLSSIVTEVSEVHYQGGGAVDLLFVVDSSGSMGEEQEALADGFADFIESFLVLEYDFHLAVTDMDYEARAGAFVGSPNVLTPDTPDLVNAFADNAQVGTFGSGTEKGLETARQAISEAKLETVNEDFWREGAVLSIIFVSDEDDFSTAEVSDYFDFFLERKNGDRRRLKINAIAGPVPDGCDTAEPGHRYKEIVDMSGGAYHDICEQELGMAELGEVLSGYKPRFELQHAPIDGEVVVYVNGEEVEGGPTTWSLNADNEVAFVPEAIPDDCSEVQIAYWTNEAVNTGGEPIEVEGEAPLCATLESPPIVLGPRSGCAQATGAAPTIALLALLLLSLAHRRPRGGQIRE